MQPKKHYGEIAASYNAYRPTYPPQLFANLASIAPGHEVAWDCATGGGQAAGEIVPLFRHVIATDASEKQINQAKRMDGIEYCVAAAEQTAIERGTVDLVVVAQALHWFDLPKFYSEVERVARPGGVLACWCYSLLKIDPAIDRLILTLYSDILKDCWAPQRRLVDDGYSTISFPFDELQPPTFEMKHNWRRDQLLGYLGTWSAVADFEQQEQKNPLSLIASELAAKWSDPNESKTVTWPLHLRVGKVPAATSR